MESIHPHRSEFEELESRLTLLELTVQRQIKVFEQQRDTLQDIADHMSALKRDYEEMKRTTNKRDLEWQEEKGNLLAQMSRDNRSINARFDQLDQNDIKQNTKIAAIEASVEGMREAAKIVIEEANDRKASDRIIKSAVSRIEMYGKLILMTGGVAALIWAIFRFAVHNS